MATLHPHSSASVEQLVGRVLALGPAVDLHRGVEPGAGGEDDLGVELARLAAGPGPTDDLRPVQWPRMSTWGLATASTMRRVISGRPSRSFECTLATTTSSRPSRSSSWSSAPSSRMSTSMPVRIRNGASSLVELGLDLVELLRAAARG